MSMELLQKASDMVWGPFTMIVIILFGGWITLKSKGRFIIKAPMAVKKLLLAECKGEITPFMSLSNALAATMGTGNIVGVATALAAGGAGALFWMQIAAISGMMIKFSEAALAVKFRRLGAGPMGYLKRIKYIGNPMAMLFAFSCAAASIGSGCMTQSNSAAGALEKLSVSPFVCAAIFGLLAWNATNGGIKGIMRFSAIMIPFITVGYLALSMVVIVKQRGDLPAVLCGVIKSAFDFKAAAGGAAGYTAGRAVRYGLSRGIFSNEAGMGSSAISYSLSSDNDIQGQGTLGIAEVFIDTIVCCTLTGLVLLLSNCELSGADGASMAIEAFSASLGYRCGNITAVFIALFGFASVCGWFTFGAEAVKTLFPNNERVLKVYHALYSVCSAAGALIASETVWLLSDIFTGAMLMINLFGMLLLTDTIGKLVS